MSDLPCSSPDAGLSDLPCSSPDAGLSELPRSSPDAGPSDLPRSSPDAGQSDLLCSSQVSALPSSAGEASSPALAAARLLLHLGPDRARDLAEDLLRRADVSEQLRGTARILVDHHARAAPIAAHARADADRAAEIASPDDAIEVARALFDRAVADSEEGSVALYSLGCPELLARATAELRAALRALGVLDPARSALEIGCGIGRVALALAGDLASVHGVDVSGAMIAAARRRAIGVANVRFSETSGRDLARFADATLDLVLAIDVFPYLRDPAGELLRTHVEESARVLRAGGDLVIVNVSYRGDLEADRGVVERLTNPAFTIRVNGTRPFHSWDGALFHLRRR